MAMEPGMLSHDFLEISHENWTLIWYNHIDLNHWAMLIFL